MGLGSDLQFDLATGGSDQINVTNAATFPAGSWTVTPSSVNPGTYVVLTATSITGIAPTLVSSGDTRLTYAYSGASYTTGGGQSKIEIVVSGQPANLVWDGIGDGTGDGTSWDLHINKNWHSTDVPAPTNPNLFFNADNVTFDDSGLANHNISLGALVQPGSITVKNTSGNYSFTGGGSIGGGGSLTMNGAGGTLTIGTSNSYSGGTSLINGQLNVNNASALGTGTLTISGGSLGNTSGQTIALSTSIPQIWTSDISFTGPNNLDLGTGAVTSTTTGAVRSFNVSAGTLTIGGDITENTASVGVAKNGTGTLVLNGTATFAGPVNINAGTLKMGGATFGALGTPTSIVVSAGAALDIGGITATDVATGIGAVPITIFGDGPAGGGALVNSGNVSQQFALQNVTLNQDSTIGATGRMDIRGGTPVLNLNGHTLTKVGTGRFSIADATVNNGSFQVNQGTLSIEGSTSLDANGTISLANNSVLQFSTNTGTITRPISTTGLVTINDNSAAGNVSTVGSGITAGGDLTLSDNNAATLNLTGAVSESPASSGRAITKTGPGVIALANASNTFSGPVNLNGGLLNFAAVGSLGTGTALNFAGGGLQYAAGMVSPPDLSTRTMTFAGGGGTIDTNGNNVTFANSIGNSGTGGFTKAGQGTLVLNGSASYTGTTTVANGTLVLGSANSFPANGGLILGDAANDGGVLDLNGRSLTVSSLNSVGVGGNVIGSGSSTPANITLTYTGGAGPSTYGGTLSNTAPSGGTGQSLALTVSTGTLVLTGGSNTYSGATTINSGATLQLGAGGSAGQGGSVGSAAIANNGTLAIGGGFPTISNAINGTGRVVVNAAGSTVTLSGSKAYTGGTVLQAGRLSISSDSAINNANTGGLTFSGGTLEVNGYTTSLPFNNGNVSIGTQSTATVGSVISTTGNFSAEGPGVLVVSAANTYGGNTTVNGGTLQLGSADRLPSTSNLTLNGSGSAVFSTGGFSHQSFGKLNITGTGSIGTIDLGSGASTVTFANSSLPVWQGTLAISNWNSGTDHVFFGSNSFSGLSHAQLNSIQFSIGSGAMLLGTGELVPNTSGTPLSTYVPGDFSGDGQVNSSTDINLMLKALSDPSAYEQSHQLSDGDFLTIADVNHDGKITNADIQPLLDLIATNGGGSLAAVPEPASWLLVTIGGLGLAGMLKRKRLAKRSA